MSLPKKHVILCSPLSKEARILGLKNTYISDKKMKKIKKLISSINAEVKIPDNTLTKIIGEDTRTPVFACTEISMQADMEGIAGVDTLKILIQRIVEEL